MTFSLASQFSLKSKGFQSILLMGEGGKVQNDVECRDMILGYC